MLVQYVSYNIYWFWLTSILSFPGTILFMNTMNTWYHVVEVLLKNQRNYIKTKNNKK